MIPPQRLCTHINFTFCHVYLGIYESNISNYSAAQKVWTHQVAAKPCLCQHHIVDCGVVLVSISDHFLFLEQLNINHTSTLTLMLLKEILKVYPGMLLKMKITLMMPYALGTSCFRTL